MDKRTIELKDLGHLDQLEGAFSSVKHDWPFAKIGINLETLLREPNLNGPSILKLIFLEFNILERARQCTSSYAGHEFPGVYTVYETSLANQLLLPLS